MAWLKPTEAFVSFESGKVDGLEEQGGAQHYVTVGQGFYVVVGQPPVAGLCPSCPSRASTVHRMGMQYTSGLGNSTETTAGSCLRGYVK